MTPLHPETFFWGAGFAVFAVLLFIGARVLASAGDAELGAGPGSAKVAGIVLFLGVGAASLLFGLWLVLASYSEGWGR